MSDGDAEKIIGLLQEIRDGQKQQIQHQVEALERQAQALARQREQSAALSVRADQSQALQDRAEKIQARSAALVGGARVILFAVVPVSLLLLILVCWLAFHR